MRGEASRPQSSPRGQEERGGAACIRKSGRHTEETPAAKVSVMSPETPHGLSCTWRTRPLSPDACREINDTPAQRLTPSPSESAFNSSFSFIQQSLNHPTQTPASSIDPAAATSQSDPSEREEAPSGGRLWRDCPWRNTDLTSDLPDCDSQSVDLEITSSLSVDSDTASASSVTSGYESATPASDHGVDNLVRKYEGVLQVCLQNNRTHTKVRDTDLSS